MLVLPIQFLPFQPPLRRYGMAVLYALGSVALRWTLEPMLGSGIVLATAYGCTALAGWHLGWVPASLTAFLSIMAMWFVFGGAGWTVPLGRDFAGVAVMIVFVEAMRRARLRAHAATAISLERHRALEREIAERVRIEAQLRAREEEVAVILNRTPFLLTRCGKDLRYRYVSQAYADMILRTPDELIGKPIAEIMGDAGFRTIRPFIERVLEGECVQYEREVMFERVGARWLQVNYTPDRDESGEVIGWVASIADITERKRVEEALIQSENKLAREAQSLRVNEERLRLAMAAGNMGAWDIDLRAGCIVWDAKQHELFGRRPSQAPQSLQEFYALLHPEDMEAVKEAATVSELTGQFSAEFRIVRGDGAIRWMAGFGATLYDEAGQPMRTVGINYDITERKEIDRQLREREGQLRTFSTQLEQLVSERTEELVQSHQRLRGLAAELNLAEARERKRLATELHDHLQQLLVLGKLKLGQGKRLSQPVPQLAQLVEEADDVLTEALAYTRSLVAELSPPVLREHGLIAGLKWLGEWMRRHELEVTVEADHDIVVLMEDQSVLLFQSVRELLINTAKHAKCARALVRVTQEPRRLSIMVRDDGKGFDTAAAWAGSTGSQGSSKFGIYSVRERMTAMGGALTIESRPGTGTTATLVMPLTVPAPSAVPDSPHHSEAPVLASAPGGKGTLRRRTSKKVTVLLVDDHAMVRQGLRSVLDTYADMDVVGEAWNGQEAVALVRKLQPSVVIMDINMPGMNGIEATASIKSQFPSIVVIGLSVNADVDNQEAMKRAGAQKLLTKEAAVDRLYQAIQSALKPAAAGQRTPASV